MLTHGDDSERLRRAIKDNNLLVVRRVLARIPDMRNPDPGPSRYTSLALAALCVHEEVFSYLLDSGHDDEDLSRDSDNNTILCLLAGVHADQPNPHAPTSPSQDLHATRGALDRMTRAYHARFPFLVDWTNIRGKTPLHIASIAGNSGIAEILCDCGADLDLTDEEGNSPLHYASSWGHIKVVQILIERGCNYAVRNNDGYTASDLAYSNSTMQSLQGFAQQQFESNKKARRYIYAEAASRGMELRKRGEQNSALLGHVSSALSLNRLRSGSGTSESTTDYETSGASLSSLGTPRSVNRPHQSSMSSTSSRPSLASDNAIYTPQAARTVGSNSAISSPSRSTFGGSATPAPPPKDVTRSKSPVPPPKDSNFPRNIALSRSMQQLSSVAAPSRALTSLNEPPSRRQQSIDLTISPVASRMRQRDADAMAHFMSRNPLTSSVSSMDSRTTEYQHPPPSPSATSTTSTSGGNGSSTSASNKLQHRVIRSLLRPSVSANALRMRHTSDMNGDAATSITPTSGANSRLRSTTLDHTPTGSGAESTSGSELDATTNVPPESEFWAAGAPRSAAMAPSLSLEGRNRMANTSTSTNGPVNGSVGGRTATWMVFHSRERRTKTDTQQQRAPSSELYAAEGQLLPRGRI